ncbi:hypothetical protein BXY70_2373 [Roseovarius halotolerans]|uniref:Lipoprotein n=1 Tax=Roseovarius halotolerans TaxID=505353 RepID=A0A1X6Z8N4_9RHOB|nr:DUF6778 family protein [Roseovarius halotolerans]RKT30384.1 hypothetical protein BXY70_2373 [Roseovarius halotolerans]SLN43701.1 hypothetical protein ROH8110_02270 [Roseovarius halotolerans]
MVTIRMFTVLLLGLVVSGCGASEISMRNASLHPGGVEAMPEPAAVPRSVDVRNIRVSVPAELKVSEANMYLPAGDIVWREDPLGDRHAQVKAIFETAMQRGVDALPHGQVPVDLNIEVTRFHALSEKARYTVGGRHTLHFVMQLSDPETGAPYGPPRAIKANLKALGGQTALEAESKGITQKVRITEHLAQVIGEELAGQASQTTAARGLFGIKTRL